MSTQNKDIKSSVKKAQNALIRAQVYCKIIEELFIFMGAKPFSNDILNITLKDSIDRFIYKQAKKLNSIIEIEVK